MNNCIINIIVHFVGYVHVMALINMRKMEHIKLLYSFYLMVQIVRNTTLLQCKYHLTTTAPDNVI